MFGFAFKGLNYEGAKSIPNLEVPVDCTLNELYNGCSKEVTYTRVVLNGDGQTTRNIQETKYRGVFVLMKLMFFQENRNQTRIQYKNCFGIR